MQKSLNKKNRENYFYIPPVKSKGTKYVSSLKEYKGYSFKRYVRSIQKYPDKHFDLVLVDGRARVACLEEATKKIKQGGYLMLDNSERKEYQTAMKKLAYERKDFIGPSPYLANKFASTTIWKIK